MMSSHHCPYLFHEGVLLEEVALHVYHIFDLEIIYMSMYQDKTKRVTYHSSACGMCIAHVVEVLQCQGYPLTHCPLHGRAVMVADLNLHSPEMWPQNEVWNPVVKAMVPNQDPFLSGPPVKSLHLNEMQN